MAFTGLNVLDFALIPFQLIEMKKHIQLIPKADLLLALRTSMEETCETEEKLVTFAV